MGFELSRMIFLLSLAAALTMAATVMSRSVESKYERRFSKWTVHVVNEMGETMEDLLLHCKSKDDDLGVHRVSIHKEFSWSFKENFWLSTLFWCHMRSWHGEVSLEVFWRERKSWLQEHCNYSDCIWIAKDDGIYLKNIPAHVDEFMSDWHRSITKA